jgi:hypothetical protein
MPEKIRVGDCDGTCGNSECRGIYEFVCCHPICEEASTYEAPQSWCDRHWRDWWEGRMNEANEALN